MLLEAEKDDVNIEYKYLIKCKVRILSYLLKWNLTIISSKLGYCTHLYIHYYLILFIFECFVSVPITFLQLYSWWVQLMILILVIGTNILGERKQKQNFKFERAEEVC